MKTILITGGAGFLGTNLCYRLIENFHIICVDNLYTGKYSNIIKLVDRVNFEFIKQDINKPIHLDRKIDYIFNLACPASPPHYQKKPLFTTKTCTLGVFNIAELAIKNNARILHASTSEVYGDPLVHPQVESYQGNVSITGIRSCYDEGKRCAESILFDYKRQIFNTYGTYMDKNDGRVVTNFIDQALKNKDITIYGDGSQTRSFCHVDDLIEGMVGFMFQNKHSGPVNLGNPKEFTIKELAEKIIFLCNSRSNLSFKELPEDDPKVRKPDITLIRSIMNWQPTVELGEGIEKTISYFKGE